MLQVLSSDKHIQAGHHLSASETPLEWRFAGGPIVAQYCMLAGIVVATGREEFMGASCYLGNFTVFQEGY